MAEAKLQGLCQHVKKYTKALLSGEIGLSRASVDISQLSSGCVLHHCQGNLDDRYLLHIPYCGATLKWTVIFRAQRPNDPPDFVFNEKDASFMPDVAKLKSLSSWKSSDPDALLHVIQELVGAYRFHQRKRLSLFESLNVQAILLNESGNFPQFDVLVNDPVETSLDVPMATFLIPLPVDLSGLPSYLTHKNPGGNKACLVVSFFLPENDPRVQVEFDPSPELHRVLSSSGPIRVPKWGQEGATCLSDYVPTVHQSLLEKVEKICDSYLRRRECILALCSLFGKALLEFDSQSFFSASFLLATPPFHFLFFIRLTGDFPTVMPVLVMQSVYHESSNQMPFTQVFSDYPYSPRWSGPEFAERTRIFLCDKAKEFKSRSTTDKLLYIIS